MDEQIASRLEKEERDRDQAIEEARRAAGAFPTLAGGHNQNEAAFNPRPSQQTHKVLSLNSITKKATVTSYTKSPVPSRPISRAESIEEEPVRIQKPSNSVSFAGKLDGTRPWADLKGESVKYIAAPVSAPVLGTADGSNMSMKKTRRNKAGKNREDDGKIGQGS